MYLAIGYALGVLSFLIFLLVVGRKQIKEALNQFKR